MTLIASDFEKIFYSSPIPSCVIQDNFFSLINRKLVEAMGYIEQELLKIPFAELIYPDDRSWVLENALSCLAGKKTPDSYEFRVFTRTGEIAYLSGFFTLIEYNNQPAIFAQCINRNFKTNSLFDHEGNYKEALAKELEISGALADLSKRLLSSASIEDISSLVLEHGKRLTSSEYGYVGHIDRQTGCLVCSALTRALEARDLITEGHAVRLQDYVTVLAGAVGMPARNISELCLLAKFHDIGKVGVPDRILFKPGPLSLEEVAEMRRHSEIGYRIAKSAPDLAPIADWILKHHEWWNGSGYPLGLKGEEIPLECRILAIADAYDAMTSDRPYRKAMAHDSAVAELKKVCRGSV